MKSFTSSFCTILPFFLGILKGVTCDEMATSPQCGEKEYSDHPVLCHMLELDQEEFVGQIREWAETHGGMVHLNFSMRSDTTETSRRLRASSSLQERKGGGTPHRPVVFAHGMGDSCFNRGMQNIVQHTSQLLNNVYTLCIPTGDNQSDDTRNGYFLNMDASVDVFAAKIRADPQLQQGFHAIGFSQGNNVIRGYIAKYNTPSVHTFLSINGVNAGIGAVPYCRPELLSHSHRTSGDSSSAVTFSMCDLLMEQASRSAYTEFAQQHSFQANYWRDPRPVATDRYRQYCQLAVWNNEAGGPINETLRENWAKTQQFVWVLATEDGMVWPREGEQWGAPDPNNPFQVILPRNETEWYQKDLFGLKTAELAGKNFYEAFVGDHLQFTQEDFEGWVHKYLA